MKSNLWRICLEWALITSLLMSVGFFVWFFTESRTLRICDSQIAIAQNHFQEMQLHMNMLSADCEVYAKTNADLARFLESLRPRQAAPAVMNKPATR